MTIPSVSERLDKLESQMTKRINRQNLMIELIIQNQTNQHLLFASLLPAIFEHDYLNSLALMQRSLIDSQSDFDTLVEQFQLQDDEFAQAILDAHRSSAQTVQAVLKTISDKVK